MIVVSAPLTLWSGQGSNWHFIAIPDAQADELRAHAFGTPRGFGSVRVDATIGAVQWRTSVFPQKSGGYLLPVKAEVRRRAGIVAGDSVTVGVELVLD